MHLGVQFTHGTAQVWPFGFRAMGENSYVGAVHIGRTGALYGQTVSFPEQQFATEAEASRFAEMRARDLIDSGALPR